MTKEITSDVFIELHVPSFKIAKDFFQSIGFEVVWEREGDEKRRGYMVMRRGKSVLNFYGGDDSVVEHSFFRNFPKNSPRGYGVEIIILIDGIEKFYSDFLNIHKENVVKELSLKYTKPDFRAVDPFGYYLRFVERYDWINEKDERG